MASYFCSKHALVHPLIGVEGMAVPHQYLQSRYIVHLIRVPTVPMDNRYNASRRTIVVVLEWIL